MLRKLLTLAFILQLSSHGDVLKNKSGAIAAKGFHQKTENGVIYWRDCKGRERQYKPDSSYTIEKGRDCATGLGATGPSLADNGVKENADHPEKGKTTNKRKGSDKNPVKKPDVDESNRHNAE